MAIGKDTRLRVMVKLEGDASQLVAEVGKIEESIEDAAQNSQRAFDTIGLGAERQLTKLQKLNNTVQGFTGKLGQGLGAIDNFAKGLAPWNQALELGKKALGFVSDAMDTYAKTSAQAAEEVAALKNEFQGYLDLVMGSTGQLAVELLKPAYSLDKLRAKMVEVEQTKFFQTFFGANTKQMLGGPAYGSIFRGDNEAGDLWGGFGLGSVDEDRLAVTFGKVNGHLDEYEKKVKKAAEAQKKAATEAARWRAELAALSSKNAADVTDALVRQLENERNAGTTAVSMDSYKAGLGKNQSRFEGMNAQLAAGSNDQRYERFQARERQSDRNYLEAAFGSVDEINAHDMALKGLQITFGGLETAVSSSMQAWISGSMSLGLAIKKGIGDALAGVASQMAIESLKHGAFALGSLAFFDFAGAAKHGAAAVAFGGGAIAAAAAARKLGSSVQAEVQAQKDAEKEAAKAAKGDSGGTRARAGSGGGDGGGQTIVHNTIVVGEHFYSESNRMRQLDAQKFVKQAGIGSPYVDHS